MRRGTIFALALATAACGRVGYHGPTPSGVGSAADAADVAADTSTAERPAAETAPPADVRGAYTATVTNGATTCNDPSWTEGTVASDVPLAITQADAAVTAEVMGGVGVLLSLTYQSSTFRGVITGDTLSLELVSTNTRRENGCVYTPKSVVDARSAGDFLTGTIRYTYTTSGGAECAAWMCASEQRFNALRPPR